MGSKPGGGGGVACGAGHRIAVIAGIADIAVIGSTGYGMEERNQSYEVKLRKVRNEWKWS